jgi:hypothetical protein
MVHYKVGDRVVQRCFGDARHERTVRVASRSTDIKNGRPGFDGYLDNGCSVWGYDEDIHSVLGQFRGLVSERARVVSAECDEQLATQFNIPAVSILTHHALRLGMTRERFEQVRSLIERETHGN